jgi:hypothetical protein
VWRDSDDSLTTAAARALAAGDPLGALKRVALRDDAHSRASLAVDANPHTSNTCPRSLNAFGGGPRGIVGIASRDCVEHNGDVGD